MMLWWALCGATDGRPSRCSVIAQKRPPPLGSRNRASPPQDWFEPIFIETVEKDTPLENLLNVTLDSALRLLLFEALADPVK
jgi:hypothetical protein